MDTLAADDLSLEAPRALHEGIVFGSIGMIALAAGLGTFYEAHAAGWLACAAGGATALLLAAGHYGLAAPTSRTTRRRTTERAQPSVKAAIVDAPRPAELPAVDVPPPVMTTQAVEQPMPMPAAPIYPQATSALDLAGARPAPFAPASPRGEIELEQLEALVRQMAAGVGGAQADTPDPDRGTAKLPATQLPPAPTAALRVGFGAPAVAADFGARVATAVAAERLDVLLAPIQSLTEQRASHFEVFMRLRDEDGHILPDADVVEAARATGLAGAIDALRLPRVARVARRVQARGGAPADVLAGVFGDSLTDQVFIDSLDRAMTGTTPPPIVLAFSQADVRGFGRVHWWALATLADIGLHFAIADLTDLDLDFDLLAARGFMYAKLDAEVFLNGLPHGTTTIPAADLTRHLAGNGLQIIVGNIGQQEQMERVAACGVALGQGALFGEPKPVRKDILEG